MIYHQTEEGLGHLLITWSEEDDTQSFRYYKLVRDYLEDLRRKKGLTALFLLTLFHYQANEIDYCRNRQQLFDNCD